MVLKSLQRRESTRPSNRAQATIQPSETGPLNQRNLQPCAALMIKIASSAATNKIQPEPDKIIVCHHMNSSCREPIADTQKTQTCRHLIITSGSVINGIQKNAPPKRPTPTQRTPRAHRTKPASTSLRGPIPKAQSAEPASKPHTQSSPSTKLITP